MIEIAHWYESIFLLAGVFCFSLSPLLGVAVSLLGVLAGGFGGQRVRRLKWQTALRSAWVVAAVLGSETSSSFPAQCDT